MLIFAPHIVGAIIDRPHVEALSAPETADETLVSGTDKSVPYKGAGEGNGVQTRFCTKIAQSLGMRGTARFPPQPRTGQQQSPYS